ncbi:MAG: beta-N-acetylhexosaminidase [Methylococcaceae bacterium]|nr:beta-N-acetylhexosaminidase [Methylococcaceae bacterium]
MIDVEGLTLTSLEKEKIQHPNTGAIILFARNYQDPKQVTQLIKDIRQARNGDILIAVDQEGGRVQRFQTGFTRLPPVACFEEHSELAEDAGWLMAAELLAVGVDFSFAPVLDVDCGVSEIIGNRSFSMDCHKASELASAFSRGMRDAGMASTGKHFPGHGFVSLDSHLALPTDERDLESIRQQDLVPFKQLIKEGLEAVMPAHIVYPQVDEHAAGFSSRWLQTILRTELGFDGVIFSDDLSMEGAASVGSFSQRAELALAAGCDMVLVCNNPEAATEVLESLAVKSRPNSEKRLLAMLGKNKFSREALFNSQRWQTISSQLNSLNHD